MKALIKLLLEEQSDQGLHCLPTPYCLKTYDHYSNLPGHDVYSVCCGFLSDITAIIHLSICKFSLDTTIFTKVHLL